MPGHSETVRVTWAQQEELWAESLRSESPGIVMHFLLQRNSFSGHVDILFLLMGCPLWLPSFWMPGIPPLLAAQQLENNLIDPCSLLVCIKGIHDHIAGFLVFTCWVNAHIKGFCVGRNLIQKLPFQKISEICNCAYVHVLAQWYIFCCLQGSAATHNCILIFSIIITQVLGWSFTKGDFWSTDIFPFFFCLQMKPGAKTVASWCIAGLASAARSLWLWLTLCRSSICRWMMLSDIVKMKKSNISPNSTSWASSWPPGEDAGTEQPLWQPRPHSSSISPRLQPECLPGGLSATTQGPPPTGMCPVDL